MFHFREAPPSVAKLAISEKNVNPDDLAVTKATSPVPASPALQQNGKVNFGEETLSKTETPHIVIDPKTLLFFDAIREGSVQKVKTLLRNKNMTLNTRDLNQYNEPTALIVACEANNVEIVRLLLSAKKAKSLDVNQEDKKGRRPIW